jgi:hypothetical protein
MAKSTDSIAEIMCNTPLRQEVGYEHMYKNVYMYKHM